MGSHEHQMASGSRTLSFRIHGAMSGEARGMALYTQEDAASSQAPTQSTVGIILETILYSNLGPGHPSVQDMRVCNGKSDSHETGLYESSENVARSHRDVARRCIDVATNHRDVAEGPSHSALGSNHGTLGSSNRARGSSHRAKGLQQDMFISYRGGGISDYYVRNLSDCLLGCAEHGPSVGQ